MSEPGAGAGLLDQPVKAFVSRLTDILVALRGDSPTADRASLERDAALEGQAAAAGIITSDGHPSDAELRAFAVAFAPWFESLRSATPDSLRDSPGIRQHRGFPITPSPLFETIVTADAKNKTAHGWSYYHDTMQIAHAVCAIDATPTREELLAVDTLRAMMIRRLDAAGIPRPANLGPESGVPDEGDKPEETLHDLQLELDKLVGLKAVKTEVRLLVNLVRVENLRRERKLPVADRSLHLVFTGNPGTGKTTVARLLARFYKVLKVVSKGHLVETDRSGLVAGYVGQTAPKVNKACDEAKGGVLFIDEAYALVTESEQDFGAEAIATLLKRMEDDRADLIVIVAGYTEPMKKFVQSNPGIKSRFNKTIEFPDYTDDELVAIFELIGKDSHYELDPKAREAVKIWFSGQPRDATFGNGRSARNLFEDCVANQANRIVNLKNPSDKQLTTITVEDIPDVTSKA